MDWFSWLSKTSLERSLAYGYALAFARNQLRSDDLAHFNHEFLQSMGVSVAKHRLEILKLARKELGPAPPTLSGLLKKTRRRLNRYISKWVPTPRRESPALAPEKCKEQPKGDKDDVIIHKPKKRIALSGPMNMKPQGKAHLRLSGPLDAKLYLKKRSPKLSGPLDGRAMSPMGYNQAHQHGNGDFESDGQLIWAALFDDLKPT